MTIWVDADACPVVIRQMLFRAAQRTGVPLILVANQFMAVPSSANIRALQVEQGFDKADDEIARRVQSGDLLISSDIPLAAEVIAKGAQVLTPRGEVLTRDNVRARLNIRDFMDTMRSSGIHTGGPPPLSESEKRAFAGKLDAWLARQKPPVA